MQNTETMTGWKAKEYIFLKSKICRREQGLSSELEGQGQEIQAFCEFKGVPGMGGGGGG